MRKVHYFPGLVLAALLIFAGCRKTIASYPVVTPASYFMPLQVGRSVTYRLDSLTFYYYGQLDTITSYQAKDSVELATTDNSGRPTWLVTRYLSDVTGTAPWVPSLTYSVTPNAQDLEITENNLRFVKLAYPIKEGYSWPGNSFLPYNPYQDFFLFSDDSHLDMQNWSYSYENVNHPFAVGTQLYDSTATITLDSEYKNVPIIDTTKFASVTYWTETYAPNIGLVYRHTQLWEYQPPTLNGSAQGYKIGFEVTLSLISHN